MIKGPVMGPCCFLVRVTAREVLCYNTTKKL